MKKIIPHPLLSVLLWLVWLLLNNTLAPGHMLLGAVLAILIPYLTTPFWSETVCIKHPLTLLRFLAVFIWDIMVANIVVAKLILGANKTLAPTFLVIDLDLKNPLAISLLANTISLTPGTVSCNVNKDKTLLLVHGLHEEDPKATIQLIKQRYEQPLKKVFESC